MKIERLLTLISVLFLMGTAAKGQIYPVTAHVQINPPTTTYLPEFTVLGSDRLSVNLFLNDFNEPVYDVRLKITIEGNGISLVTHPSYVPPVITLSPGANLFSGSDLANYLSTNHMFISGISAKKLQQGGGGLPEGIYTFCVQVFDYRRPEVALSFNHCSSRLLRKNYPPTLVAPACGSTIPVFADNQDFLFQWHSNADLSIQTIYELSLVEVPPGMNPNDAMNGASTKILDAEPVMGTSFLYGPDQLPLEITKKYAWRVKTLDVLGNTTFENNGLSPVCTFYYGMDGNGIVPLVSPLLDQRVSTVQQLTFRWNRPANAIPGQQIYYKLKVVKMLDGQDPGIALEFNPIWYEAQTDILPLNAAESLPPGLYPLPPEEHYAWEVKAYSDNNGVEQEVAVSEKRFFKSAPAVERFKAGNPDPNIITVLTLTKNEDLANSQKKISGVGTMKIRENGQEVELHFTDIIVGPFQDYWQMTQGVITEPLNNFLVHLDNSGNPAGDTTNMNNYGRADFIATHVIVELDDLKLRGKVKWQFPHVTVEGAPLVQTSEEDVFYNRYKIRDENMNVEAATFNLLDPNGFKIEYYASSSSATNFSIYNDILTLKLDGGMTTSIKVKNIGGQRITYHFNAVNNPWYFMSNNVASDDDFKIANGTSMQINPRAMTFDLSEDQSPLGISDILWKGMYFNDFVLRMPVGFDGSGQISTNNEIQAAFVESEEEFTECYADVNGLKLDLYYDWDVDSTSAEVPIVMNSFKSSLSNISLYIHKNMVGESSQLSGYFGVPFLSEGDFFVFNMDLTNNGFQEAYLDEDLGLTGYEFSMNDDDYAKAVAILVKQAVLANRNHLQMTIDLVWPALDIELINVPNFNIWGDGKLGFNTPNGSQDLATQVNGFLPGNQTFDFTVDKVGAIYDEGDMGMNVEGNTAVAENISGPAGPPRIKIGSAKMASNKASAGKNDPGHTASDDKFLGLLNADGVSYFGDGNYRLQLKANLGPTIGFNVLAMYQSDDPVWGDVLYFLADADFGIPFLTTTYQFLFQFVLGKTKRTYPAGTPPENLPPIYSYWFLELGMGSLEKTTAIAEMEKWANEQKDKASKKVDKGADRLARAYDYSGEKMAILSTKTSAAYTSFSTALSEYWAGDPNAPTAETGPGKFARAKNALYKLQSKMTINSKRVKWMSKIPYVSAGAGKVYGGAKTAYKATKKVCKAAAGGASAGASGAYAGASSAASAAHAGASSAAGAAKSACSSAASAGYTAGSWAGGRIVAGAKFSAQKFRDLGESGIGQKAKKGYAATKTKAKALQAAFKGLPQGIPIAGIFLVGLQGRLYYHMSHDVTNGIVKGAVTQAAATAEQGTSDPNSYARMVIPEFPATTSFNYKPDPNTSLGIMLMANVESVEAWPSLAITGKKFRGYGAIEVAFNNSFGIQSFGIEVSGGYMNWTVPIIIDNSMLKGYMNMGYHAPESKWRASGYFMTETNALCGVGDFDFTTTPASTSVRIGSPQRKLYFVTGCVGYYPLGYLEYKKNATSNYLDLGLGLGWQATHRYKISILVADVTPYATVGLEAGLSAKINFDPVGVERFGMWVNAWARVGIYIDWPWPAPDQDLAVGLNLGGYADIYPSNVGYWRVKGSITGGVVVGPLSFPFTVPFEQNL